MSRERVRKRQKTFLKSGDLDARVNTRRPGRGVPPAKPGVEEFDWQASKIEVPDCQTRRNRSGERTRVRFVR